MQMMKGSRNHRAWRHNHTGTPHHVPSPPPLHLPPPLMMRSDTVPLKTPPPWGGGSGISSPPFSLGLCSCDLWLFVLIHLNAPLLSKYLFSLIVISFLCRVPLSSRLLKVGGHQAWNLHPFREMYTPHGDIIEAQGSKHYPTPITAQFPSRP